MTIRKLWEDYLLRGIVHDGETPEEIALQKCAFVCGVVATIGTLSLGEEIDMEDMQSLLDEAFDEVHLTADRQWTELNPSPN